MNLNSMQAVLEQEDKRRTEILAPQTRHTKMRELAENLGRRNIGTAKARTLMKKLYDFVLELYDVDDVGTPWNVDRCDGRILIPVPWGKKGHRYWKLRQSEADILRAVVLHHWSKLDRPPFIYSPELRHWYLSLEYKGVEQVIEWLQRYQIDATNWHILHNAYLLRYQSRVLRRPKGRSSGR
jgi:hypothetical protein